jgi:hypothetical protein
MSQTNPLPSQDAHRRLIGSAVQKKPVGFFSRLFWRGGVKAIISDRRTRCFVVGVMVLVDKTTPLDGLVTDLDNDGATFRPASIYILDRGRVDVLLRFADREVRGQISSVSPLGYDIAFASSLDNSVVEEIIVTFGMDHADGTTLSASAVDPASQVKG